MISVYPGMNYYSNHAHAARHPNGSVYIVMNVIDKTQSPERWNYHVVKYENGEVSDVRRFVQRQDHPDHLGLVCFELLPDGGALFVGSFPDPKINNQFTPHYEVIPNICPPFDPAAHVTYVASAEDIYTRSMLGDAINRAKNAEKLSFDTKSEVKDFGKTVKEIVKKELAKVAIPAGAITRVEAEAIAWSKAADRIFAEINNPASPLANYVWNKAKDAAWALLVQTGLLGKQPR